MNKWSRGGESACFCRPFVWRFRAKKTPTNETSCHPDRLERVPASTLLTECRWGISEAHCSLFDGRPPHCGREGPDLLPYVRAPAHSCSVSRGVSCGMSA